MRRNILVTGATGKQGQALIRALSHPPITRSDGPAIDEHTYHIYALTRSPSSPTAKVLIESSPKITVVEGNLDVSDSIRNIFKAAEPDGGIWGVFAVLAFPGLGAEADGEERQGKLLVDLSVEYGVKCFVYSSVMRNGPKYEDGLTLDRKAKRDVERYLVEKGDGMGWTILRPGFFMENFNGFIGSITTAVLKAGLKTDTTIGLISTEDIGNVAAVVFRETEKYKSQIVVAVAEFPTITQMNEAHQRAKGKSMPAIWRPLGWLLLKFNKSTQGLIEEVEHNHHARISGEYSTCQPEIDLARSACKMKSYEEWLAQGKEGKKNTNNWNQVSIGKLLTGKL